MCSDEITCAQWWKNDTGCAPKNLMSHGSIVCVASSVASVACISKSVRNPKQAFDACARRFGVELLFHTTADVSGDCVSIIDMNSKDQTHGV